MNRTRITTVKYVSLAFVLAIVGWVVGLSGCERIASVVPDEETPQMTGEELSIGVVLDLTGQYAEPYGLPMQRGFELARKEINNAQPGAASLTFITVDAQSTVEGTKNAVQQLVDEGVPAIVGVALSTYLKEAFPIAQENGVVAFSSVSAAAGLSGIGDFIFRAGLATDILIPSSVMATQQKLGYKKVAAIYDEKDVYATSSKDELVSALEANGVDVLTVETFQTGNTDFSTQLTNIMAMEPDALFISALAQEMTEIIVQGRDIGIPDSVHFIVPDLTRDDVQKAGGAAEGVLTFTSWSNMSGAPGNQTFVENYRAAYGIEPQPWAAQSYATLYILAEAIANAQSTDSTAIRDALAQITDFPTILGNFSFDPNGEALYNSVVLIAKDGELQVFE